MKELKFICEEWKPCPEYEDTYQVSNMGRVKSVDRVAGNRPGITKGKILIQTPNRKKYLEVRLYKNSRAIPKIVHRLVAKAFIIVRQIIYGRTWKSNTTPIVRRDDRFKTNITI